MEWLEESEKSLDSELEIANDPDKIKAQLVQHKVSSAWTKHAQRALQLLVLSCPCQCHYETKKKKKKQSVK